MSRMTQTRSRIPAGYWPISQSCIFAAITLLIGMALGYLVHGSGSSTSTAPTAAPVSGSSIPTSGTAPAFDRASIQPLLTQLESRPNDPELLAQIGNHYFDGQQYQQAIDYYQRSLKLRPDNVNVRTDLGTAMWYMGNADGALQQFDQSLKIQPTHAQTLFNMGIVKSQGKNDKKGAIDAWEKLLASNPDYPDRQKVQDMMQKLRSGQ